MNEINIYFSPGAYLDRNAPGIRIIPEAAISRLPLSNIKKLLKMLIANDTPDYDNAIAFDRFIAEEAEGNGLLDPDRTEPLNSYEKKIGKVLAFWDAELNKRGVCFTGCAA